LEKYNKLFEEIFSNKEDKTSVIFDRKISKYKKLFEPIKIGNLEIKNRIVFAPLCNTGMLDTNGSFTQQAVEYYKERAKGGVGLIVSGASKVENDIEKIIPGHNGRALISISAISKITEIVEMCHYFGAKIFVQLFAGDGYNNPLPNPVGPSENPCFFRKGEKTRELSREEIEKLVQSFGTAAEILIDCGVDGVEINGHEGYLLDNFTCLLWNRRTDKYGGDLRSRLTIVREIFEAIRSAVGENFIITYKYGIKHFLKGLKSGALKEDGFIEAGRDVEEGIEMAKILEDIGYQSLIIDAGCYDSMYWVHPTNYQEHGYLVKYAAIVKKAVNIPIIAVGGLDIPDLAESVIDEGFADMVALGRSLLADPYWPDKVKKDLIEDIRPCIGCNEGCLTRALKEKTLSCTVNPEAGNEISHKLKPSTLRKKILIIGGGVAGMEAARILTIIGHNVKLYEKNKELGGHLREASVPDFKKDISRLLKWYIRQMNILKVEIKLNFEADCTTVEEESPNAIIFAAGSCNNLSDIPGIQRPNVIFASDLLIEQKNIGGKIIIVGGGMIGLETALWLAKKEKEITVIEALAEVGLDGALSNKEMLLDLLTHNEINIRKNAELIEIFNEYIEVKDRRYNSKHILEYDNLVLSTGLKQNNGLYKVIVQNFPQTDIYSIGDCKKPGKILNAIWDAFQVSRSI